MDKPTKSSPGDTIAALPPATCSACLGGSVYPIRILRDIFDLPTYEQMETCLAELSKSMLLARATNDLFAALIENKGVKVENGKCFQWPEVCNWKDDGKGEIAADYLDREGKPIFSMRTVKTEKPNAQLSHPAPQTSATAETEGQP